jgi:hypothetical protein
VGHVMEKLMGILIAAFAALTGGMFIAFRYGPKVSDAELVIRSSDDGSLTADETTAALDIGPFPLDGVPFRLTIPADAGAATTLAVIFKSSTTAGGTYFEDSRFSTDETTQTDGTKTLAGVYRKRIFVKRQFVKVTFDTTGANATYGAVDLRAEAAGEYNNADRDL